MTTVTTTTNNHQQPQKPPSKPPRPKRTISFSFAAYSKNLIQILKSSNIIIEQGLSESEFQSLQSKFNLNFPPDLRAILQQGLPISPGFPNWRSSSKQQLQILLNLPVSSVLRRVANNSFWHPSWGPLPKNPLTVSETVMNNIMNIMNTAPQLIPVYKNFYIVSSNDAGNPIFYVDRGGDVRLASFDIAGFFRDGGFLNGEVEDPVWAATKARWVEVWSDVADGRGERGWSWWWDDRRGELGECMDRVLRKLREGGWKEEEICEMMTMTITMTTTRTENAEEEEEKSVVKDREKMVVEHVRKYSRDLLNAGWSREDVVYSLGVDEVTKSWLLELDLGGGDTDISSQFETS